VRYFAESAASLSLRAVQTLRGRARDVRRHLKVDLTAREPVQHVSGEVEYLKILADEAVQ
jgi:hypothetical protein